MTGDGGERDDFWLVREFGGSSFVSGAGPARRNMFAMIQIRSML